MVNIEVKQHRIEIVDIAKCLAIIMVIFGHTSTNAELLGNPPTFVKVLYSIHMPLFFFLSGLTISPKNYTTWSEWRYFLRKNILTVAIPYILWGLIYCNFSFPSLGNLLYGSWAALGKAATVTSLWYLACLFVARIMVQCVISVLARFGKEESRLYYLIPAVVFFAIGFILPDIENGYPWCFNVAFVAAGYMMLGIVVKYAIIALSVQKEWVRFILLVASVGVYAFIVYLLGDNFTTMMMCKGDYGSNNFAYFLLAILGGFAVILLSMIIQRVSDEHLTNWNITPIVYLGQHTMGVFLVHKPMLQSIFMPFFSNLLGASHNMLARVLALVVTLVLSMGLTAVIEYYIPELVGVFSKEKINGDYMS